MRAEHAQTVGFQIEIEALRFWRQQVRYAAERGKCTVFVGVGSGRVKQGEFELL